MAVEVDEHTYLYETDSKPRQRRIEPNFLPGDSDEEGDAKPGKESDSVLPTWRGGNETKHSATPSRLDTIVEEDSSQHDQTECERERAVDSPTPPPQFKYNPLHDLESVWWVAVYMWLCSYPIKNDPTVDQAAWDEQLKAHAQLAARVFREHVFRRNFLTLKRTLTVSAAPLLPSFKAIGNELEAMRTVLTANYRLAEEDISAFDFQSAKYAYTDILESLSALQKSLAGENDIKLAFTDTRAMDEYLANLEPSGPTINVPADEEDVPADEEDGRTPKVPKTQHSGAISLGGAPTGPPML